jgi:hypothetical protein
MIGFGYREDYDKKNRFVKQEHVSYKDKDYFISTVDLGIDHGYGNFTGVYWETMVFPKGEWLDLHCERYTSREDALKGHDRIKAELLEGKIV